MPRPGAGHTLPVRLDPVVACLREHFVNFSVLGPNYQKVPFWVNK